MRSVRSLSLVVVCVLVAVACNQGGADPQPPTAIGAVSADTAATGINNIEHLIFIVQENRSFDEYFGTYPGANGYRMVNGKPANCVPDKATHHCVHPYHDSTVVDKGGMHTFEAAEKDINGGRMDGFVNVVIGRKGFCGDLPIPPRCRQFVGPANQPDVMGYHDQGEIPNYWAYAQNFVLQDRMFESAESWTLPSHLFLLSAWSAWCPDIKNPMSCRSDLHLQQDIRIQQPWQKPIYAWTSIAWLLHQHHVSWAYYVAPGTCLKAGCKRNRGTWPARNPFPGFADVRETRQMSRIRYMPEFFDAAKRGALPSVLWLASPPGTTEHPPSSVAVGQEWVTKAINAVMRSPDWNTSAIFLTWDDWGGFYDHLRPRKVDRNGYGLRVPGLMISPYARQGYIDHQTLSFDAYLKLIEARFMGGQALNPRTDGRPDSRPTVREKLKLLGDLRTEFDFTQQPRPPLILDPTP